MKKVLLVIVVLAALAATVWFVREDSRPAQSLPAIAAEAVNPAAPVADATPPAPADYPVLYLPAEDWLRVKVEDAPLIAVLAEIMRQSSVEIRIDPAADRRVSSAFDKLPLEEGIDRLTAGLNVIKEFRKASDGSNLLVSLVVLPAGKQDASAAVRAIDLKTEVGYQAGRVARAGNPTIASRAMERWQARLAQLPPETRKHYEALLAQQQERVAARAARQQSFEAREQKVREKLRAEVERIREDPALTPMDPERLARLRAQLAVPETPESVPSQP